LGEIAVVFDRVHREIEVGVEKEHGGGEDAQVGGGASRRENEE
jgi:hypothetical protein